jgi:hypothetical protein
MLQPIKGAVNRKFRPSSYRQNDNLAKETIISCLEKNGHELVTREEDYSFDITSIKNNNTYYSEVEMKNQWKGDWNPSWAEIRIPYRKHKLLNKFKALDEPKSFLHFYVLRGDCEYTWRISSKLLEESEVKEANGFRIEKGEYFFHVPFEKAELVQL